MRKHIDSTVIFFLALGIVYYFLGSRFFHMNDHVFAFGGDAAILYYNMVYHSWYGSGLHLSNMNYPMGESLLMTDAQASVSWILNKLNSIEYVKNHVVGIVHGFHYFCFALAAVFAQKTLRTLGVSRWMAIIGGLLIVFMSPQILRIRAHYGLAYPIMFTSTIYAIVKLTQSADQQINRWKYLFLLAGTLLFFGFNNIYLLILAAGWSILFAAIYSLLNRDKKVISILATAGISVLIVFACIKLTAPDMERLVVQWGYYANRINFKSIFHPYTSAIGTFLKYPKGNIEAACNIGVVSSAFTILTLIGLFFRSSRVMIMKSFKRHKMMSSLLLSSFIILFYATGALKFLAEAIPAATMFKASGRFAWPFYYAISFISILALDAIWKKAGSNNSKFKWLLVVPILIWSVECYTYLRKHVKFNQYENHYSSERLDKIKNDLINEGLALDEFQAIYTLPTMIGWNDKYHVKFPWSTEYNATRLSMATGIPMINAMLSRMGLDRADAICQLTAHPMLPRPLVDEFEQDKSILLVVGKDAKLTRGENQIKNNATLIKSLKGHDLYRLNPSDLAPANPLNVECDEFQDYWIYEGFNNVENQKKLYGSGSKTIDRDQQIFSKSGLQEDSLYYDRFEESQLSLSVYTDNKKYGMPWIHIKQYDGSNQLLKEDHYDMASSKNVFKSWRIGNFDFSQNENIDRLEIHLNNINQSFFIDELLIRPKGDNLCSQLPNSIGILPME